jgi:hypothetical protein
VLYRCPSTSVTRMPARVSREMADSPAKPAPQMTTWGAFGSGWCLLAIVLTSGPDVPRPMLQVQGDQFGTQAPLAGRGRG